MEQSVPGAQNEPFFELLYPTNAARAPPSFSSHNGPDDAHLPPELSLSLSHSHTHTRTLDDMTPSYDFQLTHSSKSGDGAKFGDGGARLEASLHKGPPSASFGDNHYEPQGSLTSDPARGFDYGKPKEERDTCDPVTIAAFERTMKNYADNLLSVLEGVSGRLSQLETTVQGLEHSIESLKLAEGENLNQSNGRLTRLELLIKEIHTGVQLLHDKQKVDEAKSQLTKSQPAYDKAAVGGVAQTPSADGWQQPKEEVSPHVASSEPSQQLTQHLPARYAPQPPSHYPHAPPPQPQAFAAPQSSPPTGMNEPGNLTSQQAYPPPPQPHLPVLPSMAQPPPPQHSMQMPSFHFQPPPPQGTYNPQVEANPYGHMQPHQHHPAPPTPVSSTYSSELPQYTPGTYGGPRQHPVPQEVLHSSQQHGPSGSQHMYDPVVGRVGPTPGVMAPPYVQLPPQSSPPVSMYETPSGGGYGTPSYRAAQPLPSAPSGGGASYPRLPTAQPLHHALPTSNGGPVGSASTNRPQIDEVTEKVVAMGFSREQVRAVARHLTENGQSVELNVVLDKLMNGGGGSPQPPRGWFGRG